MIILYTFGCKVLIMNFVFSGKHEMLSIRVRRIKNLNYTYETYMSTALTKENGLGHLCKSHLINNLN
jgi:hypothetical protein